MAQTEYRTPETHTTVRVAATTHAHIKRHYRDSETIASVIDRGIDALEREAQLPDRVTDALATDLPSVDADAEDTTNIQVWNATHARLEGHKRNGETFDDVIARAVAALDRSGALPEAVTEVCEE
jgi:hypothetical protein